MFQVILCTVQHVRVPSRQRIRGSSLPVLWQCHKNGITRSDNLERVDLAVALALAWFGFGFVLTTKIPSARPRSLTDSVLPVPAGPAGAPPKYMPKACASVM